MTTVFVCEDSIEGILTGVYEAYASKIGHTRCRLTTDADEYELFCEYRTVEVNAVKAAKVRNTIEKRLGDIAYMNLCMAMASYETDKAEAVYKTIVIGLAMEHGKQVMEHLTNPYVCRVFELQRNVSNELMHERGFLRFEELESKILVCLYHPKNNLTAFLVPHFADRFPNENFIIYDEQRKITAVHEKGKQWFLLHGQVLDDNALLNISREEQYYKKLFQHFCHTIAIESRINLDLQRQMLPLRFRDHMPEFTEIALTEEADRAIINA